MQTDAAVRRGFVKEAASVLKCCPHGLVSGGARTLETAGVGMKQPGASVVVHGEDDIDEGEADVVNALLSPHAHLQAQPQSAVLIIYYVDTAGSQCCRSHRGKGADISAGLCWETKLEPGGEARPRQGQCRCGGGQKCQSGKRCSVAVPPESTQIDDGSDRGIGNGRFQVHYSAAGAAVSSRPGERRELTGPGVEPPPHRHTDRAGCVWSLAAWCLDANDELCLGGGHYGSRCQLHSGQPLTHGHQQPLTPPLNFILVNRQGVGCKAELLETVYTRRERHGKAFPTENVVAQVADVFAQASAASALTRAELGFVEAGIYPAGIAAGPRVNDFETLERDIGAQMHLLVEALSEAGRVLLLLHGGLARNPHLQLGCDVVEGLGQGAVVSGRRGVDGC